MCSLKLDHQTFGEMEGHAIILIFDKYYNQNGGIISSEGNIEKYFFCDTELYPRWWAGLYITIQQVMCSLKLDHHTFWWDGGPYNYTDIWEIKIVYTCEV